MSERLERGKERGIPEQSPPAEDLLGLHIGGLPLITINGVPYTERRQIGLGAETGIMRRGAARDHAKASVNRGLAGTVACVVHAAGAPDGV